MSFGVEVLHLGVVSPLVADVHGGGDGAAVGVLATHAEEVVVEAFVEVVYRVVKCEEDKLRDLYWREPICLYKCGGGKVIWCSAWR